MGYTYTEVESAHLLSEDVMNCIPRTCECGSEIEFTDTLRQIYCSNPNCYHKIAARLEKMAKLMNVDGWGESTCVEICRRWKLVSPFQALLMYKLQNLQQYGIAGLEKKVNDLISSSKKEIALWELVKYAGIPNIEQTAYKIFNGYDSIEDAYKDIKAGEVSYIATKLGIRNSSTAVMASRIYAELMEHEEELRFGETVFNIKKQTGRAICIAITGGVSGFYNKSQFIEYINNRYKGKVNAVQTNVSQSIDVLVADGDTSSNKFKKATNINTKYLESLLNRGEISRDEIGKDIDGDFKRAGEKILITESEELISRLDKIYL